MIALDLYLSQPFAQHALIAGALVASTCGLIAPFVVTRGMAFAVHGTSELAFTGAAAGLLVADNALAGALVGAVVVAIVIGVLGVRERERDSAIGVILAFGLGLGVYFLGRYHGFATAATNILFGNIFGVSNTQLLGLVAIGLVVLAVIVTIYRPLLFASVDPEVAAARGVPVRLLGIVFLIVLAFTVTQAAQVVGTLLVLSLDDRARRGRAAALVEPADRDGVVGAVRVRRGRRRHPREPGEHDGEAERLRDHVQLRDLRLGKAVEAPVRGRKRTAHSRLTAGFRRRCWRRRGGVLRSRLRAARGAAA